jgi:tetratricopeptide (TPR) repeat protein
VPKLVIFAIMKMKFIGDAVICLWVCFLWVGCKQEIKRFISPDDTSYSEDIRAISQKINDDPRNAELYYTRANTFFFEDRYKDAIADIDVAILLQPKVAFYYFKKAEYLMAGDTADAKGAEKALKMSLELEPDNHEASFKLGLIWLAKQQYLETSELMQNILKKEADNSDALFILGMVQKEMRDTTRTIQRFREAAEANNTFYNAYMQLALLLLDDNPDLAMKYLDNALRIDEFSDEAVYTKGLLLQQKGSFSAAKEFYKRTIELNPTHKLAYYNMAYVETEIGTLYKAIEYLDKLLDMDPEYVPALHFRGALHAELKQYAQARRSLNLALELEPDNAELQSDLRNLPPGK